MPFITEELWHRLPQYSHARSIALEPYPKPNYHSADSRAEQDMTLLQEIITASRNVRAEMKVDSKRKVSAQFSSEDASVRSLVEGNLDSLTRLANLSSLQISSGHLDAAGAAIRSTAQFDLRIPYGEAIDKPAETARLKKEIDRLQKDIESKGKRLADDTFRSKAPADIVRAMEGTLAERTSELQKLRDRLSQLGS
jgi:valyl-tRNA synthetase